MGTTVIDFDLVDTINKIYTKSVTFDALINVIDVSMLVNKKNTETMASICLRATLFANMRCKSQLKKFPKNCPNITT